MTIFHEPITLDKKVSGKNLGGVLIVTQTCLFPKIHPWKLVLANFYLQGIRFIHVDCWNLNGEVPSFGNMGLNFIWKYCDFENK